MEQMSARGITLRLLGGVGVALSSAKVLNGAPHREIDDIDAMVRKRDGRPLRGALVEQGYEPEQRFNALHGHRRLIFHGPQGKLDVFVEAFEMCHRLDLGARLELDSPTLTASDLLLTKLQVVELSDKDVQDAVLLLEAHEVGGSDPAVIDTDYIGRLLADDWGLWRTVTGNLEELKGHESSTRSKVDKLIDAVELTPKTRRFKLRAMVGERKPWYVLPEETGIG